FGYINYKIFYFKMALDELRAEDISRVKTPEERFVKPGTNPRLKYAYNKSVQTKQVKGFKGTQALTNPYALLRYSPAEGSSNKLYDAPGNEGGITPIESRNPSFDKIID